MKSGIALVFGGKKPKKEEMGDDGGDKMPSMPSLDDIAGDLIDAVKAGDRNGVAKALRASHAACSDDDYDDEDTE
jgi:hypothetical protein